MFTYWTVQDILSDFGGITWEVNSIGRQILSVSLHAEVIVAGYKAL